MVIYSHSKLSTFEQCSLKFKFRYIDKIIPEIEKTIEAHLGSAIHSTLEWLYRQVMKKTVPSIEDVIIYYTTKWEESYTDNTIIVKKNLSVKDYFNKGIKFLIDYYTKHQPFDDNTLETEKKIIINLDEEGQYKIQGFIDRLVYNLKTEEYEVHDYKTANNLPLKEKVENNRQLALYSIAIKDLFGNERKVCLIWHYLAYNQKICSRRTNEQLAKLKQETLELIKKIESTTEFPSNKTILCDWCEYKTICPEFSEKESKFEKQSKLKDEEIIEKEKLLDIW